MFKKILVTLFFLLNCNSFKFWKYLPESKSEETNIYIVSHGWHTGIVLKSENLGEELKFLNQIFGYHPYYEIGWGDKGFYEAEEITTKITLKAMFIPTPTVLHIVAVPELPENYFLNSEVIKIPISKKAHSILNQSILKTFKKKANGEIVKTKKGIYGNSFFFEANGSYYILNTCNTWTAQTLEEAGLPINSILTLTARSVLSQSRDALKSYFCCRN